MYKLLLLLFIGNIIIGYCLKNGQALTPPMGFLTWGRFRCITDCTLYPKDCISEDLIRRTARLMVDNGYLAAGYKYITIDDCWSEKIRDPNGTILADKKRFPHGMKDLAQYVKNMGLSFGIYADIGTLTCGGYPGMAGFMEKDMATYNEYGTSYIKVDGCYIDRKDMPDAYIRLSNIIMQNYTSMTYSCSWPAYTDSEAKEIDYTQIVEHCNLWRSYGDIEDSAQSLWSIIGHYQRKFGSYNKAEIGAWNDADMLTVGGFGVSLNMQRVQMAVWCLMPSPLMISTDLADISIESKEILLNKLAISINQDPLGKPGKFIPYKNSLDVWCRPLVDGVAFAVISKRQDFPLMEYFNISTIGLKSNMVGIVENVFTSTLQQLTEILLLRVNPQGVEFFKIHLSNLKENVSLCEKLSSSSKISDDEFDGYRVRNGKKPNRKDLV